MIRGNSTDTATKKNQVIQGSVDKQTQKVAFTVGDNQANVVETGLYNLTKDEAPVLIHFGKDRTEQWLLVRLQTEPGCRNAGGSHDLRMAPGRTDEFRQRRRSDTVTPRLDSTNGLHQSSLEEPTAMKANHRLLCRRPYSPLLCWWQSRSVHAQVQVTGTLGSPGATTTIDGKQLPAPDPKFGGVIKDDALQSKALVGAAHRASQAAPQCAADHHR